MPGNASHPLQIVAISNPRSGRNKRGGFDKFTQAVARYPSITHRVTRNENELLDVLEDCRQQVSQILIINGGDGSLLQVLTYLKDPVNANYNPALVLLQAGTTSMAYGDVGCKGKLDAVLAKITAYAEGDNRALARTQRNVLRMTLPQESLTVCGMFFGGGVIYNAILYCRQNLHTKGMRGELGPSLAMIRFIFDWLTVNKLTTSARATVQIDQTDAIEGDYTILTATTLKRLLMGVYPYWGKSLTGEVSNGFALSLIKRRAPGMRKAFVRILRGRPPAVETQENYYRSACPSKAILDIHDGFTLDGELFGQPGQVTQVVLEVAGEISFLTT